VAESDVAVLQVPGTAGVSGPFGRRSVLGRLIRIKLAVFAMVILLLVTGMAALAGLPENEALELANGKALLGYREISGVAIGVATGLGGPPACFLIERHFRRFLAGADPWRRLRDLSDAALLASGSFRISPVEADLVVPVPGTALERDEAIRPDTSSEKLATLKPSFRPDGTITAGNASPLNDGAAALLLADGDVAARVGREPLARIVARGVSAVQPPMYGIGPVEAAKTALGKAGIGWDDLAVVELNEAFAAQSLACLRDWPELDPEKVNPNGGAIAIGHPIGCSGARIIGSLAHELRRRGGGFGLASICIGVGQGLAVVVES